MIYYKTEEEINLMYESAQVLGKAHGEVAKYVKPGVKTKDLDKIAYEYIKDNGGVPSFLDYQGFPATLCISENDQVVHGIPNEHVLVEGDIISIDCGVKLNGFHSDSAFTYPVGEVQDEVMALLVATKESLYIGIENAIIGNRIGDIGFSIQKYVEDKGYGVVRELVGHGLGKELHEDPQVPNYGRRGRGAQIKNGLVIAIEPMINLGTKDIVSESDGWTIRTKDRKPSAHFEHTVAVYGGKTHVLTTFEYIEETFKF